MNADGDYISKLIAIGMPGRRKCQRMGKGGMYLFQEKLKITLTGFKPCQGYFQKRLKIHAPWFLYLISSASP